MDVFNNADPIYVAAAMCKTLIEHPEVPPHREVWFLMSCGYPLRAIADHIDMVRQARDELTKGRDHVTANRA